MSAVTLALLAAIVNAGTAILSKGLASRYPARPIIGVLLLMNCLIMLPFAPFVEWHWSAEIVVLHVVSAVLLVVSSVPVWDMFDTGAASATATAQALSPIFAAVGAALLIPGSVSAAPGARRRHRRRGGHLDAARRVRAARPARQRRPHPRHGRRRRAPRPWRRGSSPTKGSGVVETYVVRTGLGAAVLLMLIPPRGVPGSAVPRLFTRSLAVSAYFALVILAVQRGSPVVVQTIIAITPLLTIGYESLRDRTWPASRGLAGAALVAVGVAVVMVA